MSKVIKYDITYQSLFRILAVIALVWAILNLGQLIVYLLFALIFSIALHPLVRWFEKKGLRRGLALSIVLMLVVGVVFLSVGLALYTIAVNFFEFWQDFPNYLDQLKQYTWLEPYIKQAKTVITSINTSDVLSFGLISIGQLLSSVAGIINWLVIVFFLTVFMSMESNYLMRVVNSLLPQNWKGKSKNINPVVVDIIGGYIRGQVVTSFFMFIAAFIIYRILGIPNAFPLAVFAAITDVIPIVGGFIGVVPAAIVGLTISPLAAILVAVLMNTYQTINNNYITPRVYGTSLKLSPFFVMVSTTAGFMLFGVVGILLALPVAALTGFVLTEYSNIPVIEEENKGKN